MYLLAAVEVEGGRAGIALSSVRMSPALAGPPGIALSSVVMPSFSAGGVGMALSWGVVPVLPLAGGVGIALSWGVASGAVFLSLMSWFLRCDGESARPVR
ncbi:hypothetical protein E4N62_36960 [Streptomyces sp. MNU76]|uniref:hypothetical protein n=1 Tax=Streptomyces sp. MNU76 TaxID=2560026 RepID=UPI001E56C280|nr:hypothetical protein [Streptomyces sp. MNU76]MCC9710355.1 hypothetical protein [Streptomyces sp. MNU76]